MRRKKSGPMSLNGTRRHRDLTCLKSEPPVTAFAIPSDRSQPPYRHETLLLECEKKWHLLTGIYAWPSSLTGG